MVKKSIIAIALMGMLATVSYGQSQPAGDQPYTPGAPGQVKIDGLWPATFTWSYTPIEICRIPIFIKVGMFIEIEECAKKKIVLEQVSCSDPGKFPCYKGCVTIRVRANFAAQLSLKLYRLAAVIDDGYADPGEQIIPGDSKWKAYFVGGTPPTTSNTWLIPGDGNWNTVQICVEAWEVNIYAAGPNTEAKVGEVAVLAVPTATPDFCEYFNCD